MGDLAGKQERVMIRNKGMKDLREYYQLDLDLEIEILFFYGKARDMRGIPFFCLKLCESKKAVMEEDGRVGRDKCNTLIKMMEGAYFSKN